MGFIINYLIFNVKFNQSSMFFFVENFSNSARISPLNKEAAFKLRIHREAIYFIFMGLEIG